MKFQIYFKKLCFSLVKGFEILRFQFRNGFTYFKEISGVILGIKASGQMIKFKKYFQNLDFVGELFSFTELSFSIGSVNGSRW